MSETASKPSRLSRIWAAIERIEALPIPAEERERLLVPWLKDLSEEKAREAEMVLR